MAEEEEGLHIEKREDRANSEIVVDSDQKPQIAPDHDDNGSDNSPECTSQDQSNGTDSAGSTITEATINLGVDIPSVNDISDEHRRLIEERDKLKREIDELNNKEKMNLEITLQLKEKCFVQQEQLEKLEQEMKEERFAHSECQKELNQKLKELSEGQSSQETIMSRILVLDTERMKLLDEQVALERKNKDLSKENDRMQSMVKLQKSEISKLTSTITKHDAKIADQTTDIKKLTDDVASINIKLKWAQNKLKSETEAHKAAKSELTSTLKKLKVAREESDQIRKDMKRLIEEYQESEEMKSNTLDSQLKKKEEEVKQQEQEIADQSQLHDLTVKELQLCRESLEISQQECAGLKNRVSELTSQITEKQGELDEQKSKLSKEKREQKKLNSEIDAMREMNTDIEKERQAFSALKESYAHLQKVHQHLEREIAKRKEKEAELLAFSEKLSSSNAQLMAGKGVLETQVNNLEEQLRVIKEELSSVGKRNSDLDAELAELKSSTEMDRIQSMEQLHTKSLAVEQLTLALEEEREQISALKRKHANNIKDMQRQIQLYSKRIEHLETNQSTSLTNIPTLHVDSGHPVTAAGGGSIGMRSLSHNSLDGSTGNLVHVTTYPNINNHHNRMPSPDDGSPTLKVQNSMFETLDQEKTVLVEKICSLNKTLARRDERIEFFEGHTSQLTDDLKKKSRIIQSYIIRDTSGALAPPQADAHKERFRRKSGIMASVFSGAPQKGSPEMTLDMSLEINRKMQAVLEDTLIKNITLKESLDTLGQEIARLTEDKRMNGTSSSPSAAVLPKR